MTSITYASAYTHRAALDALVTPADRNLLLGPGEDESEPAAWHYLNAPGYSAIAILVDGSVAGMVQFGQSDYWTETAFFLAEAYRGQGIMQKAWESNSQRYGSTFRASTWEDNLPSRRLLERLGFEHTRSRVHDDGRTSCTYILIR